MEKVGGKITLWLYRKANAFGVVGQIKESGNSMRYLARIFAGPFVFIGWLATMIGCMIGAPFTLWDSKIVREAREWWSHYFN